MKHVKSIFEWKVQKLRESTEKSIFNKYRWKYKSISRILQFHNFTNYLYLLDTN